MSVQNASHAVLEEVATVGVSLLHTFCGVRSVGSRWWPTKESLVGMASAEVRSTWTTRPPRTRKSPSCGPTQCNSWEDMVYMMRVTGAYNEPLDRQIMERVQISNFQGPVLINRRNEMGGIRIDKMRYRRWGGD